MSLFSEAAHLNNQAVVALTQGDDLFAIQSMTEAIKLMKQELASRQQQNSEETDEDKLLVNDMNSLALGSELKTVEIPDICCCADDHHEIFNQAIHVPCTGSESDIDVHVYSGAVVFNLALAHHKQALRDSNRHLEQKAIKLYGMVLRFIDDTLVDLPTALMVKLAAINNLTQLQFANGGYEEARQGLEQVSGFVKYASGEVLAQPKVQGLLMNVLMIRQTSKVAAAA